VPIRTYRDLDVYQEAFRAAIDISRLTRTFPKIEQPELARQLRRSARSVPANIVEGWAKRASAAEFKRYLQVAIGSCHETQMWLEMSREEGYISAEECEGFRNRYNRIGAMLQSLWKRWRDFAR
jgi:four helix bundle protein